MDTPQTRAELAKLIPRDGLVIELGVAAGQFANQMLQANPMIHYVGIDRWSDHHDADEMLSAINLVSWHTSAVMLRYSFHEALPLIPDGAASMVYVDGYAHTGQEGGQTLRDWWPKVKRGGIFAGHDYDAASYPQTVHAVNCFVRDLLDGGESVDLHIIDEKPHPSWWLVKP